MDTSPLYTVVNKYLNTHTHTHIHTQSVAAERISQNKCTIVNYIVHLRAFHMVRNAITVGPK